MIEVYYGAADRDRDRFMFDRIGEAMPADTILIVPDQFTLQAERNAFEYMDGGLASAGDDYAAEEYVIQAEKKALKYLNTDALLRLEIMSPASLANRVVSKYGRPKGIPVDRYGRFMLLMKLMLDEKRTDGIFSEVNRKSSFVSLLNDLISEMKQYGISPEKLSEIADEFPVETDEILHEKLSDIGIVYEKYQEHIEGKFTDSEDYQQFVAEMICRSERIAGSEIWIDGFDYISPGLMAQIESLACTAKNVSIVFTGDDSGSNVFDISRYMRRQLHDMAQRRGIDYKEVYIPGDYQVKMEPAVSVIEAGDFYAEAESIAIEIMELIREKGLRYSDIVIICNDSEKRGSVFRRVFDDYDIPLFIDRKRNITQEPVVEFIFAMLDVVGRRRVFSDVFRMLKTGFGPVSDELCDELENYCRKYNIRSGRWKRDFVYGLADEGEEKLGRLNGGRAAIDEFISEAENLFRGRETVREKAEALYSFLAGTADIPEKLGRAADILESMDFFDYAQGCSQIWDSIINILDQIVEVIGDEVIGDDEFGTILKKGFEEVEIGIIPPNNDQVLFGTMQRTRTGRVKAMFVAGVNEGVLPEIPDSEGILSEEEKQLINERTLRISRTDDIRDMEQRLSSYKNISKAEEYLCFSYAEMDADGTPIRPSELINEVKERFPDIRIMRDYIYSGQAEKLIQTPRSTLSHLTSSMRRYMDGEEISDVWKAAALVSDGQEGYETAKQGLFYRNDVEHVKRSQVRELFGRGKAKELIVSTSAIERYSRCPFSFFISYGLRPREERTFEVDSRSIGDIYHECLRKISDVLTEPGVKITAPESKWMKITREECRELVDKYVDEFADRYREGVFNQEGRDRYIRDRIKEICGQTAWIMIRQVQSGKVRNIFFEQRFGKRSDALFPAVEIDLGKDGSVYIEGIIDRTDVIEVEDDDHEYVRIIDYKSGHEEFDKDEVISGWRLQLMTYLKGAMGGIRNSRPAGVFYFSIKEPAVDITEIHDDEVDKKVADTIIKNNRLDGVLVNSNPIIESMDTSYAESDNINVITATRKKDGSYYGKCLLTEEDFENLVAMTDANLKENAGNFAGGNIDIDPKSGKKVNACTFCNFRSICNKE